MNNDFESPNRVIQCQISVFAMIDRSLIIDCVSLLKTFQVRFIALPPFLLRTPWIITSENACRCQVATMTRITRGHHILRVEHLLSEFRHCWCIESLRAFGRERCKAGHEEMQTRKRYHIDSQFAKIGIQLAGETKAGGNTGHCELHEIKKRNQDLN